MTERPGRVVGHVDVIARYPVKSMQGQEMPSILLSERGFSGDRAWAVVDRESGKIASAKRPKFWRGLLACATHAADGLGWVEVELPSGARHRCGDPALDQALSSLLGRAVWVAATPPAGAELDRSHPEAVLAEGLDAEVGSDVIEMGAASPAGTFFDYAPLHLLTSATLDAISAAVPGGPIERQRYRANVVIRSPAGEPAFPENDWLGGTLSIGDEAIVDIVLRTPRCAIPTLSQGALPARNAALRAVADLNSVEVEGFGVQPCAGVYATVARGGRISHGAEVVLRGA